MKRSVIILALVCWTLVGCAGMSMTTRNSLADIAKEAACSAAVLGCLEAGGDAVTCDLVGKSCRTVGGAAAKTLLAKTEMASPAEIRSTVTRAWSVSPIRTNLRARRGIGFRVPVPVKDSTPVQ